ncbi:recombinase RecT [Agromyces lapidis]|uniref:Recombinase RecT n=1 Tax=Agromyces lapidis TaxID=279574 RepID=A0ABV5SME0_9MICO|nr:recombinase RecT [Agromyces lapidis]
MVPQSADPAKWSLEQGALLEFAGLVKTVMKDGQRVKEYAPVSVTQAFIQAVQRSGLDPFARQIYAAEMGGKWTILGAIDGFRAVAAASKEYEGRTPIQYTADGVTWTDVWLSQDNPAAARVGVKRKGYNDYAYTVVTWAEFGRTTGQWRSQPAHMLGIRVLSHALRDAFPQLLGGIYTPEDFDHQADAIVIEPSEDWGALIAVATTKEDLSVIAERARNRNEYSDDVRTLVLTRAGAISRGEIESEPVITQAYHDAKEES